MAQTGMVAGGRLTDWISLGVLASAVPRDAVDEAIEVTGRAAKRSGGKLPPHVMVYFAMALALFADDDYEEVAARLAGTLRDWDCWDEAWEVPTSGGITQARQRLGYEPIRELFSQVAGPVAEELTRGAFLGPWRLMAIDGVEWDAPATSGNIAAFGFSGASAGDPEKAVFPKARVVTISECASHAIVDARIGGVAGKGAGEQSLARPMLRQLAEDWLLIADRNFYNWEDWCAASDTGAALLWRAKADLRLPVLELIEAARRGEDLEEDKARYVRVIEYEVPDREGGGTGELIALITTITDPRQAPAAVLAEAYHERWEHETGNRQLKTYLRGPGRVLRSQSPDMVRQEIYGYLLTHFAISALICTAATEADIDPDRVKFKRTVRLVRRRAADPAFPP
jgi:Insertion element 4 transposase N-terminal/Transposase DDE domain